MDRGITKDKYLDLQDKMGKEPDLEKMPPDISDFPYDVQVGIAVYNKLGDRYSPEYGYLGKDYINVKIFSEIYQVDNLELFMETILRMDEKLIKSLQEKAKAERAKNKNKR